VDGVDGRDHSKLAPGQSAGARSGVDGVGTTTSSTRGKGLTVPLQAAEESGVRADGQGAPSLRYLEEVRQHHERLPAISRGGADRVGGCAVDWEELFHERDYARKCRGHGVPVPDKSALPRAHRPEEPAVAGGRRAASLGERNVIEMTGVTAVVRIRAAVAALVGVSGTCGLTVEA